MMTNIKLEMYQYNSFSSHITGRYRRDEKYLQYLVVKHKGGDHLEDMAIDGRTILEWLLGKQLGYGLDALAQ
jgi:hypothetical protein